MEKYQLCTHNRMSYRAYFIIVVLISSCYGIFGGKVAMAKDSMAAIELRSEVTQYAEKFIGKPYIYGAEGPEAFDCSGLTKHVYRNFNIDLPHYTGTQWGCGSGICKNELKDGDLVFFNTTGKLSHVGIYIGNNKFIHAPSKGKTVKINSLNEPYYSQRYAGARRII